MKMAMGLGQAAAVSLVLLSLSNDSCAALDEVSGTPADAMQVPDASPQTMPLFKA